MIDPRDIFNAHRVVQSPSAYRRIRTPKLSGVVIPPVASPERRAALGRVIQRTVTDRLSTGRPGAARRAVAERVAKLRRR